MKLSTPNKNNNKGNNNIDKIQKQKVVISEKKEINNNILYLYKFILKKNH